MSSRIAAALTLDINGFQSGITKAEADANKFSARLREKGVGLFGGKSARESADAFGSIFSAQDKLTASRSRIAYNEADTVGKIKIVSGELRSLALARNQTEQGTVEYLQTQLAIEERLAQLRGLQRGQAAANAANSPPLPPGQTGATSGGGLMSILKRKFGIGDALKDTLKSFGIGGVGALAGSLTSYFTRSADYAGNEESTRRTMAEGLTSRLSSRGPEAALLATRNAARGVTLELEETKRAFAELQSNPLNFIHPLWQAEVDKLQAKIGSLTTEQDALLGQVDDYAKKMRDANRELDIQLGVENAIHDLRMKGASESIIASVRIKEAEAKLQNLQADKAGPLAIRQAKAAVEAAQNNRMEVTMQENFERESLQLKIGLQERLNRLKRQPDTVARQARAEYDAALKAEQLMKGGRRYDAAGIQAARLARIEAQGNLEAVLSAGGRAQRLGRVGLGESIAGTAAAGGGLSEIQRVARRGAQYEADASEALLMGDGTRAARLTRLAMRDLGTAGARVQSAAKDVPSDTGLKNEIIGGATDLKSAAADLKAAAADLKNVEVEVNL